MCNLLNWVAAKLRFLYDDHNDFIDSKETKISIIEVNALIRPIVSIWHVFETHVNKIFADMTLTSIWKWAIAFNIRTPRLRTTKFFRCYTLLSAKFFRSLMLSSTKFLREFTVIDPKNCSDVRSYLVQVLHGVDVIDCKILQGISSLWERWKVQIFKPFVFHD